MKRLMLLVFLALSLPAISVSQTWVHLPSSGGSDGDPDDGDHVSRTGGKVLNPYFLLSA